MAARVMEIEVMRTAGGAVLLAEQRRIFFGLFHGWVRNEGGVSDEVLILRRPRNATRSQRRLLDAARTPRGSDCALLNPLDNSIDKKGC